MLVTFKANIGTCAVPVWVTVDFEKGERAVGLSDQFDIESVHMFDDKGHLAGLDISGCLSQEQEDELIEQAKNELRAEIEQARMDAQIDQWEAA